MGKRIIVAITGASGAIYARRFVERALELDGVEIDLIASTQAQELFAYELGAESNTTPSPNILNYFDLPQDARQRIRRLGCDDLTAPPASGSYRADGMIVVPCSMKTLGAMAAGYADNLITRAADVQLKERRPLIIVPREAPLNAIHLENMLKLTRAGGVILPASPPFYHKPKTIDALVDAVVFRAMALMGLEHPGAFHWGE